MDKRRALSALLVLSLGSCSRHEHLAPINYSPPTTGLSDTEIRTAIVQQSITSYQVPWPCPYSAPTCQGHSAYDKPTNQPVYCYTKDVPAGLVSSYRTTHASRAPNDQPHQEPLPINPPHSEGSIVSPKYHAGAAELESYCKIVEAALNDVTAKAFALAGADMTRATPPSIAKSPVVKSPSYDNPSFSL